MKPSETAKTADSSPNKVQIYHPAPLVTFQPERGALFDLYLAVPTRAGQRYVLYKSSDIDLTRQNVVDLMDRGVRYLYISDDDAPGYFQYVNRTLGETLESSSVSPEKKSQILYETTTDLVRAAFSRPESPMLIQTNRTLIEHTTRAVVAEPSVYRTMISMLATDYSLYTHCVNVATIGLGLLMEFQSGESDDLSGTAMGFLLHDIGKSRVPTEILQKTGILTKHELQEIERHPVHGVEIMQAHENISPSALKVIRGHHEKLDGHGYPDHLPAERIPIETRICSVVDVFDALTSNRAYKPAMTAYDAINLIRSQMSHDLDADIVSILIHVLGPRKAATV